MSGIDAWVQLYAHWLTAVGTAIGLFGVILAALTAARRRRELRMRDASYGALLRGFRDVRTRLPQLASGGVLPLDAVQRESTILHRRALDLLYVTVQPSPADLGGWYRRGLLDNADLDYIRSLVLRGSA